MTFAYNAASTEVEWAIVYCLRQVPNQQNSLSSEEVRKSLPDEVYLSQAVEPKFYPAIMAVCASPRHSGQLNGKEVRSTCLLVSQVLVPSLPRKFGIVRSD